MRRGGGGKTNVEDGERTGKAGTEWVEAGGGERSRIIMVRREEAKRKAG